MKLVYIVLRTVLGVLYLVYGLNCFFNILPLNDLPTIRANALLTAMQKSNYLIEMIGFFTLATGVSVLFNLFTPFLLIIFLPFVINFFLFQYFMGGELFFTAETFTSMIVLLLHFFVALGYIQNYTGLFKHK